jgi:hypothetical protein
MTIPEIGAKFREFGDFGRGATVAKDFFFLRHSI